MEPPKDFISQYCIARSGTSVPPRFIRWSAIAVLALVVGRKVFINHQHYELFPGIHICFIGKPNSKKSSAMRDARDLLEMAIPDYPSGASITSREDIVKYMASDHCLREYMNQSGEIIKWRPLACFANELTNFISFNPEGMIEFLTDCFDVKAYKSSTIARGMEFIIHPYLQILACTTVDKYIGVMKAELIGGGFSRRLLPILEIDPQPRITFPVKSKEAYEAEAWCLQHLLKINQIVGEFQWEPEARLFLDEWYQKLPTPNDNAFSGYFDSKDSIVQKIAMCLAIAEPEPRLFLTRRHLLIAMVFLADIEKHFPRLLAGAGRNELAIPQAKLMELLQKRGGWMPEKQWHKDATQDMSEREYRETKDMLKSTDMLYEHMVLYNGILERMVVNKEKYDELLKSGGLAEKL